jgi:type I restriction enzyme, S subunit
MRRKLIEADVIDCVIGLGPNLFYNSPMEACVVVSRSSKPNAHKGRILFINAVKEVTRERAQSFLTDGHINRIVTAYRTFKDHPGFTRVVPLAGIRAKGGNLSIPLYVGPASSSSGEEASFSHVPAALVGWLESSVQVRESFSTLRGTGASDSTIPRINPDWAKISLFSQKNWTRLPFGSFADSINDRVEPANAAEAVYVGLDDLDSGSLHIRRWGKGSDVIGTKLRFRKSDIIFGRRRAYQRKLAVAEMEGICSAHAMVVRAKPNIVLPEFLPFLMISDKFMSRALEISVGSLSPTINWSTLRLQEFELPPVGQQRQIARILWALDDCIEKGLQQYHACEMAYSAAINSLLFDAKNPRKRVAEVSRINRSTLSDSKTDPQFEFKYIDIGSIVAPKTLGPLEVYRFSNAPGRARRCVKPGDILISTVRPNLKAFLRLGQLDTAYVASTGFAAITPADEVIGRLLFHAFFSTHFMVHCNGRVTGTSYPAISAKDVGDFLLHLPNERTKQLDAARFLDALEKHSKLLGEHVVKSSRMQKQLIEHFFYDAQ